jgi:hypothetical protein
MLLDFRGKRKNTLACGSSIFTLSESLATSLVHGSRNPARENHSVFLYPSTVQDETGWKDETSVLAENLRPRQTFFRLLQIAGI